MRDGFYGISMLWPVANSTHRRDFATSAAWMFSHAREGDGLMPQACPPSGRCQYGQAGTPPVTGQYFRICNGTEGAAGWRHCQDLDSAGFAVKLAHHIWSHLADPEEARTFYNRWAAVLERGMNATAHDPAGTGLLWSNTSSPNVGYVCRRHRHRHHHEHSVVFVAANHCQQPAGPDNRCDGVCVCAQGFEDTVVKTGAVLYSSILSWNASRQLGAMATAAADTALATRMAAAAGRIKASADALLWNQSAGVFMASTGIEGDRVDVWANAFAGASGFASAAQSRAIFEFVSRHERGLFFEGQVRQLPAPQQWAVAMGHQNIDGMWAGNPTGPASAAGGTVVTYQNGGYW
eukprot:SAG11_NODE_2037_length_3894_cov_3.210277_2_plen_349_part_00